MKKDKFFSILILVGVVAVAFFGAATAFTLFTDYIRGFLLGLGSSLILFGLVGKISGIILKKWVDKPE
ncbi:MAG: hypothetical protein PHG02_06480 [Oscillospiraceae bacterium]|nr:hypothetical protein [Oscillospiraceae bacterium]